MARKKLYPCIEQAEKQRSISSNNNTHVWEQYGYKTEEEYLDKQLHWSQEKILVWFNID